jgi:hypothetical protein
MFVPESTLTQAARSDPSVDQLEQRILAAHALVGWAQHELCRAVAAHARSAAHRLDGARDEADWLARRLALEPATARRIAELAEKLDELPALASALATGELSLDQTAAAAAFATPALDDEVAEAARGLTPAQIEHLGDELFPPEPKDDATLVRERRLDLRWVDRRRVLRISGRLPLEQGLIFEGAIRRLADERTAILDEDSGLGRATEPETYATRCADALVSLAATATIEAELDPARTSVILHLRPGAPPQLEHGGIVSRAVAERLACDARVQVVTLKADGTAHATRLTRTAPDPLLRVLRERDRTCRFPGCSATRHLHSHHKWHWFYEGPTTEDNLLLLCGRHHRFLHEHDWHVTGASHALRFHRPDGTTLGTGPPAHAPPAAVAVA